MGFYHEDKTVLMRFAQLDFPSLNDEESKTKLPEILMAYIRLARARATPNLSGRKRNEELDFEVLCFEK